MASAAAAAVADVPVTKETALQMLQRIRDAAEEAIAQKSSCVFLVLRREHIPRGKFLIMCQTEGPRGQVVNAVHRDGMWKVTACFLASAVKVWCEKKIQTILKTAN